MILVDSSGWIDQLREIDSPSTEVLDETYGEEPVVAVDLIIATFCISLGITLLFSAGDFKQYFAHLSLVVVSATASK